MYVTKDFLFKFFNKFNLFFLKDHVTLKTGVMADESSALPSQE